MAERTWSSAGTETVHYVLTGRQSESVAFGTFGN